MFSFNTLLFERAVSTIEGHVVSIRPGHLSFHSRNQVPGSIVKQIKGSPVLEVIRDHERDVY